LLEVIRLSAPESVNANASSLSPETDSQTGRTVLRLRELILTGEFGPGERISEHPLTVRLNVSRTPIRLALERLAHEGLLEPYPTGGFVVRKFTLNDVWDGLEVRGLLEGGAARLAAEHWTRESDLDPLRKAQSNIDEMGEPTADSFPAFLELNDIFHAEIVNLAKNDMLRKALDRLFSFPFTSPRALVTLHPKLHTAAQLYIISQEHHHRILEAIVNRQGARAESLAREHAQLSRRNFEIVLADTDSLRSLPGGSLIHQPK
jgi:GntR family transcriptional regulator, vanillate catabolism transcriptional regulator